jgi:hypothetical protein
MVQRFRTEATAAASLQHPHIVAIHEVGLCDGQHFIAMDYVEGNSLAEIVRDGPLEARRAAEYVKTVAEAIHFAHERKILHRDLKPSNILVGTSGQPRVTDFGLARRLDAETAVTLSGDMLGSPAYMAPEQAAARRGQVDRRTDVCSLGAVLYHLITGRPPFVADSVAAVVHAVMHNDAVSPRVLVPGLPRDLETICLKCLEKEPARRYATAQELAGELARFLRHEPILARPLSRAQRVWRWAEHKPVLASLIVLVHLVAAVGLAGIVWQWLRAEQNATEAGTQRDMAEGRLYAAQLRLAHADYQAGRLGSVQQRLEAWIPAPSRPDWRGFEWRWLQRLCASSPGEVVATNANGFPAVDATTDGQTLALGANDGTVRLVDARSGTLRKSWLAHPGIVDSVAFIPGLPRRLVTVGGDDGQLKIWDADEARLLTSAPCAKGLLARVAVSSGGRFLAAQAANEDSVNVWEFIPDAAGGPLQLRRHLSVQGSGPAAFSPDELTLVVANRDGFHLPLCNLSSGAVEVLHPTGEASAACGNLRMLRKQQLIGEKYMKQIMQQTFGRIPGLKNALLTVAGLLVVILVALAIPTWSAQAKDRHHRNPLTLAGTWREEIPAPFPFVVYETFTADGGSVESNHGPSGPGAGIGTWTRIGSRQFLATFYRPLFKPVAGGPFPFESDGVH